MEEKDEKMALCELIARIHEITGTSPEWELMYILKNGAILLSNKWKEVWTNERIKRENEGREEIWEFEKNSKEYFEEYASLAELFKNIELKKIDLH